MFWVDKCGQIFVAPPFRGTREVRKHLPRQNRKKTIVRCPICNRRIRLPIIPGKTLEVNCPSGCKTFLIQHPKKKSLIAPLSIFAIAVVIMMGLYSGSDRKSEVIEPVKASQIRQSDHSLYATQSTKPADYVIPFSVGYKVVDWRTKTIYHDENAIVIEGVAISGRYGRHKVDMMVDTGATTSIITRRAAERTGPFSIYGRTRVGKLADGSKAELPTTKRNLNVDNLKADLDVSVLSNYTDHIWEDSASYNLLGLDFFDGYDFQIDTRKKRILLWEK